MRATQSSWEHADTLRLVAVGLAALVARVAYLAFLDVPQYDPWRHLHLVDNLRAGLGFTLFDGQPFLWYSPSWYRLVAVFPEIVRPEWVAALCSILAVPLFYGFLRSSENRLVATIGALLLALCGPVVRFTCHYGPEAFALCVALAALWLFCSSRAVVWAALAGSLYGVALAARMNFLFMSPMFVPTLRTRARTVAFGAGTFVPLALSWWRNHSVISSHDWVFTWDGLATRSADFNPLSTLILQLHPAVKEGLRRLHEIVAPVPQWTQSWWLIAFVALGSLAGLASRRLWLGLTIAGTLFYFLVLDDGMSSNFFRIYLVLFPAFAYAVALVCNRFSDDPVVVAAVIAVFLGSGAPMFRPPPMVPIGMVTPPPGLLGDELYLVNSGFFHPEGMMRGHPERRFLGLPIDDAQLEDFLADYSEARTVLWHDFSVQDEVREALIARPGTTLERSAVNDFGRRYTVFELEAR